MSNLDSIKRSANLALGKIAAIKKQTEEYNQELESLEKEIAIYQEAIFLGKKCIERTLELVQYLEKINSEGLSLIFGKPFKYILEESYDKAGILKGLDLKIQVGNGKPDDPLTALGSSSVQITGIINASAINVLANGMGETQPVLFLDEPFSHLSPALQEKAKLFITTLAKEAGVDIVMVSHLPGSIGKVYGVKMENDISFVEEM